MLGQPSLGGLQHVACPMMCFGDKESDTFGCVFRDHRQSTQRVKEFGYFDLTQEIRIVQNVMMIPDDEIEG